jgi:hypothetical protein
VASAVQEWIEGLDPEVSYVRVDHGKTVRSAVSVGRVAHKPSEPTATVDALDKRIRSLAGTGGVIRLRAYRRGETAPDDTLQLQNATSEAEAEAETETTNGIGAAFSRAMQTIDAFAANLTQLNSRLLSTVDEQSGVIATLAARVTAAEVELRHATERADAGTETPTARAWDQAAPVLLQLAGAIASGAAPVPAEIASSATAAAPAAATSAATTAASA